MTVRKIVPIVNRKSAGDMAIQHAARIVSFLKLGELVRGLQHRFETSEEKITILSLQGFEELQNLPFNEEAILQSSEGSGIFSKCARASSSVSHLASGSSNTFPASFRRLAHRSFLSEAKNTSNSPCDFSSKEATSCFSISRLMVLVNHISSSCAIIAQGSELPALRRPLSTPNPHSAVPVTHRPTGRRMFALSFHSS